MFAVIFELQSKPEKADEYLKLATYLKPKLEAIEGCHRHRSVLEQAHEWPPAVSFDLARRKGDRSVAYGRVNRLRGCRIDAVAVWAK
jgi:hypothetical protein